MSAALRLFEPADDGAPRGADLSLSEFFRMYFEKLPRPRPLRERTLKQYRESVRLWAEITGDPPLSSIDDFLIAKFLEGLRQRPGVRRGVSPTCFSELSDQTIRKHATHVQGVLDMAGPRSRRRPTAQGFLDEPPLIVKPRQETGEVLDDFTLPEIGLWLAACYKARQPRVDGISPPAWWRAIVLVGYNTGLRIGTLTALRWEWQFEHPRGLGRFLDVPAWALKQRRKQHVYLNAFSIAALDAIRPGVPIAGQLFPRADRELLFPWPLSEGRLHANRRDILQSSGLPESRQLGFHGLRKALGTTLGEINPRAASMALGHSGGKDVTRDHYSATALMCRAMDQLPQPSQ